jgi:hypothetical protein
MNMNEMASGFSPAWWVFLSAAVSSINLLAGCC